MNSLSLVIPYYENPTMLRMHFDEWQSWPKDVLERVQFVIVDDGSPTRPAFPVYNEIEDREPALNFALYRVNEDRLWHQHGARNLGAHEATGEWLLLTDMDHLCSLATMRGVLEIEQADTVFTFGRVDYPDMARTLNPKTGGLKPHPNSFLMTKKLYWRVGGYDEDYCGVYGTDGLFRARLRAHRQQHLHDLPLIRVHRDHVADAATDAPRKEGRASNAKALVRHRKAREGRSNKIVTLNFPWERIA